MTRHLSAALLATAVATGLLASHGARLEAQGAATTTGRPTLIVLLLMDQMRAYYLTRNSTHWNGGLKRLMTEGAWYQNAAYPYLSTVTCAGHATISTGRFPRSHGIVMNSWLDRQTGKVVDCTGDPRESTVTAEGETPGGDSAWRLQGPTLAEKVKSAGGRGVTMSAKPRSAIMPAGKHGDAVVWFGGRGEFVTSSAYSKELPAFVRATLKAAPINDDRTKPWTRLLPPEDYIGPDDGLAERTPAGWTTVFPHVLDQPQFLGLWQVSAFLTTLDEKVGAGKYVVALTADHGVAEIPEQARAEGQDAGRLDMDLIRSTIERTLRPLFGRRTTPAVAGILYTDVYLMPDVR